MQEHWYNIRCFTASNWFMPENRVAWLSGIVYANVSLKLTRQFANRCSLVVSLGSAMTLCISGKTNNFLWNELLVFNTSLSSPYLVFGIGYAFCTLERVVIRIFDAVFVAESNFTIVLWRSWETNIFRFKNITLGFITNLIVFFVFWKFFVHFFYWQFWIEILLVWWILVFIVADCCVVWVYKQANDFCIRFIKWWMTTAAMFYWCFCTVATLALSKHHFGYHSIWFETRYAWKHRFTYNYIFAIF